MAYAASSVQGSTLQFKQASGVTSYTTLKGVLSASESAEEADVIDVTAIDDASEVSLTGFAKPGTMTIEFAYDPKDTVQIALRNCATATGAAKLCDLKTTFNDGTTTDSSREWTGASVSKFDVQVAAKDALKATCVIKLSGSPTNVAGS